MKRYLSLILSALLLVGCSAVTPEKEKPEITTPPVKESLPPVSVARTKYKQGDHIVWEYKRVDNESNLVIIGQRVEYNNDSIYFNLILCRKSSEPLKVLKLEDDRSINKYAVFRRPRLSNSESEEFVNKTEYPILLYKNNYSYGVNLIFKSRYDLLGVSLPTNAFYIEYPDFIGVFSMTWDEWNKLIDVVVNKEL